MKTNGFTFRALLTAGALTAMMLSAVQLNARAQAVEGEVQNAPAHRTGMYQERVDARVAHLQEALGLSEDQATQIRTIYVDHRQTLRETAGRRTAEDANRRETRAAVFQAVHDQIASVLTQEQQTAYRAVIEARPMTLGRGGSRMHGERPGAAGGFQRGGRGGNGPGFRVAPAV